MSETVTLARVIEALDRYKIRATYSAVAQATGTVPRAVGAQLGQREPSKSWIVASTTGLPSGYSPAQCHPELRSKITIIRTGDGIRKLLRRTL
jgi:hypothetical protein